MVDLNDLLKGIPCDQKVVAIQQFLNRLDRQGRILLVLQHFDAACVWFRDVSWFVTHVSLHNNTMQLGEGVKILLEL